MSMNFHRKLPIPQEVKKEFPLTEKMAQMQLELDEARAQLARETAAVAAIQAQLTEKDGALIQMQQEKELLQLSLQQGKYNQKRAAELLGLTYHQFRALLKKHQI